MKGYTSSNIRSDLLCRRTYTVKRVCNSYRGLFVAVVQADVWWKKRRHDESRSVCSAVHAVTQGEEFVGGVMLAALRVIQPVCRLPKKKKKV